MKFRETRSEELERPPVHGVGRSVFALSVVVVLFVASGATCNRGMIRSFNQVGPPAPQVLMPGATGDQIAAAVNQNTMRITTLRAPNATISMPGAVGLPTLRGNLAVERPRRFRMTAGTGVTGQEIDLGSNDELFWLWVKRNEPPAVYFARHGQFSGSAAQQLLPIDPEWLLSAVGLVEIDPASIYQGPNPRNNGTVELRTTMATPNGTLHRVLLVDAARGWVIEQHIYDAAGSTLLASAVAQSHRFDPIAQVSLPDRISLRLPTAQLALTLDLGDVLINQPTGDPAQLWTMPAFPGFAHVDLGNSPPGVPLPGQPQPVGPPLGNDWRTGTP